jgi:hypothetical protein
VIPAKSKYADSKSSAYLQYVVYMAENREVPNRNIGVPPVRKYANYRTLPIPDVLIMFSVN